MRTVTSLLTAVRPRRKTMYRSNPWFVRLASALLPFTLLCPALVSLPPGHASASTTPRPLFRVEFDSAPVGALSGALSVETGTVVPQGGSVAVANTLFGRALALDGAGGQATALMQWLTYPDGLPIDATTGVTLTQEVHVRITGDFTTALSGTAGGSFGLLNGANFFELFSFGPSNALKRGGATI